MEIGKDLLDSAWNYYQSELPNLEEIRRQAAELPSKPVYSDRTWEEYDQMFSIAPASESERLLRRIQQPIDHQILSDSLRRAGFLTVPV